MHFGPLMGVAPAIMRTFQFYTDATGAELNAESAKYQHGLPLLA